MRTCFLRLDVGSLSARNCRADFASVFACTHSHCRTFHQSLDAIGSRHVPARLQSSMLQLVSDTGIDRRLTYGEISCALQALIMNTKAADAPAVSPRRRAFSGT